MKLKKKVKVVLLLILLIIIAIGGFFLYKKLNKEEVVKEVKIVNEVDDFGYQLKDSKSAHYKELFGELKEILTKDPVDEEAYAKKVAEMFIVDFYSLSDKTAKTDIGGVDFVYNDIKENFLQNAENTYYKYVETNIYNNRKQALPVVGDVSINDIKQEPFAYGEKTDEKAYTINISWNYTDSQFASYQTNATMILIHDEKKLSIVELQ